MARHLLVGAIALAALAAVLAGAALTSASARPGTSPRTRLWVGAWSVTTRLVHDLATMPNAKLSKRGDALRPLLEAPGSGGATVRSGL